MTTAPPRSRWSPTRRRQEMVSLLRDQGIDDRAVLDAMAEVPRERFVASEFAGVAYEPRPLPIAAGQTISAPWIVARMAASLALTGRERVLEVGAGSGYAAAVLARCAREVIAVETDAGLAEIAARALDATGTPNVAVMHGDGTAGVPDEAPFDGISVAAMAPGRLPPALIDQLSNTGTLVCPVGGRNDGHLVRYRRGRSESLGAVSFVTLRSPGTP